MDKGRREFLKMAAAAAAALVAGPALALGKEDLGIEDGPTTTTVAAPPPKDQIRTVEILAPPKREGTKIGLDQETWGQDTDTPFMLSLSADVTEEGLKELKEQLEEAAKDQDFSVITSFSVGLQGSQWETIEWPQLKKGMVFRLREPTGELVDRTTDHVVCRATEDAKQVDVGGEVGLTWAVKADPHHLWTTEALA